MCSSVSVCAALPCEVGAARARALAPQAAHGRDMPARRAGRDNAACDLVQEMCIGLRAYGGIAERGGEAKKFLAGEHSHPCVMSKSEVSEVHSEQESEEMIPNLCFKKRQHGKRQLRPLSGPVTLLSLVTDNRQHATESLKMPEPWPCLLYTSPSPRDRQKSRMPSSA